MPELVEIHKGTEWTIFATKDVVQAIKGAKGKQKRKEILRVKMILERFASTPPGKRAFDGSQLKNEGRFPTGSKRSMGVLVWAVKAYQSRVYGCQDGKTKRFIITECDLGKKQNKADQSKLRSAARKFGEIIDEER